MIQTLGLINGHYECHSFEETMPILKDILALEVDGEKDGDLVLKHPNTDWRLIVCEGGPNLSDKPLLNHYGVRVSSNKEVDKAHQYLEGKEKQFRIKIIKPREYHHAYSVHFYEPGGNFWEIESYENAVKLGIGKTTDPHWKAPLSEERFPGRGYIPQALTHGTIECGSLVNSRQFYQDVLGLEIVQLLPISIYLKHASTPWYIVCVQVTEKSRHYLSPRQRFTLAVESVGSVKGAHQRFKENSEELRITELREVKENSDGASFLLSDLDRNWWEITSSLQ